MKDLALDIQDLRVVYPNRSGGLVAVDSFSLQIEAGEFFGLLGPNGAGKTSVIHSITNLIRFSKGNIKIFGETASSLKGRAITGVVPQELVNHGYFSVRQILNFYSGYFGFRNNKKRLGYLAGKLGLEEHLDKKMAQLSGGMKRRVMIAKALAHSPKLLLLDEPSAGVDVELRHSLWEFAKELNREGTTILLTTHYLEEAENLCQRVAILNFGKVLSLGPTRKLIQEFSERKISFYFKNKRQAPGSWPANIHPDKVDEKEWVVSLPQWVSFAECMSALQIQVEDLADVRVEEGALEDAFRRVVGGRK